MAKVQVEAMQSTETWHHKRRTGLEERIYANETFQTSSGETWHAGSPHNGASKNYLSVPLALNGNKLAYPDFEIDTTEDSPTKADPRLSSYVFAGGTLLFPHLLGFAVPVTFPNIITWEALEQHRDARRGPRPFPGSYEVGVVENLIARALGLRNVASVNDIGMAMSSFPAIDPAAPIHVSVTDPVWNALIAGQGLVAGAGRAVMVDGVVTVPSAAVLDTSVIVPASMSEGVTGNLRAVNIVPGVSFDIASSNFGDNGEVSWFLSNP